MQTYNSLNNPGTTGLDLLNEVRHEFSLYLWKQIQIVKNIPVSDKQQARALSQHIGQRLATMRLLAILSDVEVSQATNHLSRILNSPAEPDAIVFAPVSDEAFKSYKPKNLIAAWNNILQNFFTHCLVNGKTQRHEEQVRMYLFAENAISCWKDLHMLSEQEFAAAQQIINEYRAGQTPDTHYQITIQ